MLVLARRFLAASLVLVAVAACSDFASPTATEGAVPTPLFKGGTGGGGGGTPAVARCATVTVTNNPQTVRNLVMPVIKYNLSGCGTDPIAVTVTVSEWAGFLSDLCPSPVAAPVQVALASKQKVSGTFPVFRGPCGMTSNINGVLVQGFNRWQGHNLRLTVTDDSNGAVLSSSNFSWQDELPNGP